MTIHYGKRDPGGLTASSPGDTLFIPLSFYQDSGASVSIGSTLAVSDVEVFKNGGITERATDSGYAILGDTGNFDDRTGFKGISVQLFNTSDDTGFYDAGSQYWVAIDSVTVDARTVRFWAAVFEIGTPRANVIEVNGDTGQATHLGQMADEYDTGRLPAEASATTDTGAISNAVWNSVRAQHTTAGSFGASDTGINDRLAKILADTDTGIPDVAAIADAVWNETISGHQTANTFGRELTLGGGVLQDTTVDTGLTPTSTSFRLAAGSTVDDFYNDQTFHITSGTGVGQARTILDYVGATRTITIDEALAVTPATGDGIVILSNHVHPLVQIAESVWDEADTGHNVSGTMGWHNQNSDTGTDERLSRLDTGQGSIATKVDVLDTGMSETIDRILSDTDTGLKTGLAVNVDQIDGDTGPADRLGKFADVLSSAGQIDTGTLDGTQAGTIDANVTYVNETAVGGTGDTGAGDPWGPA